MNGFNTVVLMGNLTRDPEVRKTPSGMSVADLTMAINEKYKTGDGETKESTCFVDLIVWGAMAELCGNRLSKGSSVLVDGKLQYDQWETSDTREKRSKIKVRVKMIHFLDRRETSAFEEEPTKGRATTDRRRDSVGGDTEFCP